MTDYVAVARQGILGLLHSEHAALWLEIEAKLAETPQPLAPRGINPHHLSTARKQLTAERLIEQISSKTRGGGAIPVLALTDRRRTKTAYAKAAARKRLLHARYLSWTRAEKNRPNLIGDGGEKVAHASLVEAAASGVGYRLVRPKGGHVTQLFGKPIAGGPLDDAAYLVTLDSEQRPISITVTIEVKNIRHWIYPDSADLFQLLDKTARLQIANPSQLFLPVLVCRMPHYTTFLMAKTLGFSIFYTMFQPLLPHSRVSPTALEEVRTELSYNIRQTTAPHEKLVEGFKRTLPEHAVDTASRWAKTAPLFAPFYRQLRNESLLWQIRRSAMRDFRKAIDEFRETIGELRRETEEPVEIIENYYDYIDESPF